MYVILVVEIAMVWLAYGLLEWAYANNYYCYGIPYEDGTYAVLCSYIP